MVSLEDASVGQFVEATVVSATERAVTLTIGTRVSIICICICIWFLVFGLWFLVFGLH